MIHAFLRPIGFRSIKDSKELFQILEDIVKHPDEHVRTVDANGNQINKGYTRNDNYHEIAASQIALARFGAHWPAGFNSLCNGKSDQTNLRVIENGVNMKLAVGNVWTHIPVLFRLPYNAADVASYDVLFYSSASSSPGYTPGNWVLEASPDMIHWTCLHEVTSVDVFTIRTGILHLQHLGH